MRHLTILVSLLLAAITPGCGEQGVCFMSFPEPEQMPAAPLYARQAAAPAHRLHADGGQLYDEADRKVVIRGVNWFGFEVGNTCVDGLWQGPDSATHDFATVVRRIKALGFNAVRLPISFADFRLHPKDQARRCSFASEAELRRITLRPGTNSVKPLPRLPHPPPASKDTCSADLPKDSVRNRLLYVVRFLARNGFYVVLENHLNTDETLLRNPGGWMAEWRNLVRELAVDRNVAARLMIDPLNEPDSKGLRWEKQGGKPGMTDTYLAAFDALYPLARDALLLVEGTGQSGLAKNWGDGLATTAKVVHDRRLSDANPFFAAVVRRPYASRVVLAPHLYPPSISRATSEVTGKALFSRLSDSFGDKTVGKGYCDGGTCRRFPVVLGEIGSAMQPVDTAAMNDFAAYITNSGAGKDGRHQALSGWIYWAWNSNSGDTGGLPQANWRDINWSKFDYLQKLGLRGWW